MSGLTDRLERDLREVAAGADPSPSAWESILARLDDDAGSEVALVLAPGPDRSNRPVWPAVAAAVLLVIAGSIAVLVRADDDHPAPIAASDLTTTFVSPANGFSVRYLDRGEGTVTPAPRLLADNLDNDLDVVDTGSAAVFKGTSLEFPDDGPCLDSEYEPVPCGSTDEQVDRHLSQEHVRFDGCGVPRSQQEEITIDGTPGRIAECANLIEATVMTEGRLYIFILSHDRADARAVFDAFAATIDLTPETAVDYPALRTTFVSPSHGYSFGYIDRGGLTPATERWDPASQPRDHTEVDARFDAVETGFGAYFEAASTEMPAGVSADEWVDEHATPPAAGGCGVPRSQQEEISIDGTPDRVAECASRVEATVIAGGRLYLFILSHDRRDARAFFDAWIDTIDLTPETATIP